MQPRTPVTLRPSRTATMIVGVMLAVGLGATAPAAADSDQDIRGNDTGGGWVAGEKQLRLTAQEKTDIAAKQRLWDAYWDYTEGGMSREDYADAQARAERDLGVQLREPSDSAIPPCDPRCPSTKTLLPVRHSPQGTTFTCGSTTGFMIAKYEGRKRSRLNGARLTGKNMGGRKHMRTYLRKSTPWASKNFKRGLNRWLKGKSRGFYQQHATPSTRRYKKALRYDIDHGHPFAASTIEFENGKHYNGHPSYLTIGHWIVVRGYKKNLRRSAFLDPAAKSSALPSYTGTKRFDMKSKRMARAFLRPSHGIAA